MRLQIADCRRAVSNYYRIPKRVLLAPADQPGARQFRVARPRMVAMVLAREFTGASTTQIGIHFGGRDHTTVIHACRRIKAWEKTRPTVALALEDLRLTLLTYRAQMGAEP